MESFAVAMVSCPRASGATLHSRASPAISGVDGTIGTLSGKCAKFARPRYPYEEEPNHSMSRHEGESAVAATPEHCQYSSCVSDGAVLVEAAAAALGAAGAACTLVACTL